MKDKSKIVITDYDVITPYGVGLDCCWNALLNGKSAIKRIDRFNTEHFITSNAAVIPGLNTTLDESLVIQMLNRLFLQQKQNIPIDAKLFLATTAGEIDLLEKSVLSGEGDAKDSNIRNLLCKTESIVGVKQGSGILVSAACASSTAAIARASMMIKTGEIDCALVVACDSVSEFVFSGFSSLMALDGNVAKPFDKNRNGLSLGEAVGYILLMSEERAKREQNENHGQIIGWGFSSDSYHMTGPTPDGSGLAKAIKNALKYSGLIADDIGSISAHGTGTKYNDSMEINAFNSIFDKPTPTFSIKGGTGHTLAAAGLLETLITLKSFKEKVVPPTLGFITPDDGCENWISPQQQNISKNKYALKVNSGFGGVNAALIIKS